MIGELVVFVGIIAVAGGVGVALGMLLAPRIGRLVERGDDPAATEDAGDQRDH